MFLSVLFTPKKRHLAEPQSTLHLLIYAKPNDENQTSSDEYLVKKQTTMLLDTLWFVLHILSSGKLNFFGYIFLSVIFISLLSKIS